MYLEEGDAPALAKLTKEREERLVARLHDQSMAHRQETLRELETRFYPTMPPKRLTKETIENSVMRQVNQEMAVRQAAREEREARIQESYKTRKLPAEEVEKSVECLYTQSIERKKAIMEENRKRYLYVGPPVIHKKSSHIREYVTHLAMPKKREFTVDEINKIYGLATKSAKEAGASDRLDAAAAAAAAAGEAQHESQR
ncbi:hypothetical protein TraAM80_07972 [Trypanosoma rangeli]|uniref:Uncharacterized protein n=1 Tax=Trypanosoma rangeli TaxID=5698 RepID=A0A3R7M5H7_TRYRA|nr:uncharacterized protein TraAM80_07972 [Trypanosoma rangeli]RNE99784.1 hypothetical protein TraAM80_07972 [Trypanosoma rangeli]|eukprot:RNE99784.1 hypothetical protein TraAM80_07972 [Trypanosoma rangeli]